MPSPLAPAVQASLDNARSYPEYREFLTALLATGKTTGPNQSELYLRIAHLNQARMDRLDRKVRLTEDFQNLLGGLRNNYLLLVLTEGWCGDAAQIVPVLHWLENATDNIELRLALRDENPDLMDHFLTEGGRSIPKVIFLNPITHEVLADWGPRPAEAQRMSMEYKHKPAPKEDYETHHKELHTWYARDKTAATQAELLTVLKTLEVATD